MYFSACLGVWIYLVNYVIFAHRVYSLNFVKCACEQEMVAAGLEIMQYSVRIYFLQQDLY